jgi:hypothetical protein
MTSKLRDRLNVLCVVQIIVSVCDHTKNTTAGVSRGCGRLSSICGENSPLFCVSELAQRDIRRQGGAKRNRIDRMDERNDVED